MLLVAGLLVAAAQSATSSAQLAPTAHPALPSNPTELWLVPSENDRAARSTTTFAALTAGIKQFQEGNHAAALTSFTHPSLAKTALADYATYYAGLARLYRGKRFDGQVFAVYLVGYALLRSLVEVFRGDYPARTFGVLTPAHWVSVGILFIGFALWWKLPRTLATPAPRGATTK